LDWLSSDAPDRFGDPLLVVVSGPSGVGKDAVFQYMRDLDRPWHFVVTATTRPRRRSERNGIDYLFLDTEEFQHMREGKQFLEYAQVYGNWYGVPKQQVKDALAKGKDVFVKLDVQGAATVRALVKNALMIFLAPPSIAELERRLRFRQSESVQTLRLRSEAAQGEMKAMDDFEYRVVNHNQRLDLAAFCIDAIVTAEKCRIPPRRVEIR
jgi:guanylate kinase